MIMSKSWIFLGLLLLFGNLFCSYAYGQLLTKGDNIEPLLSTTTATKLRSSKQNFSHSTKTCLEKRKTHHDQLKKRSLLAARQNDDDESSSLNTTQASPNNVTGTTQVHDPSIVSLPNGNGYLVFSTGAHLPIRQSDDLRTWRSAGSVFSDGDPEATTNYTDGGDLWAPDIRFHNGTYYLYYTASTFGSQNSAIFLATSETAESGSWRDQGLVISSSSGDDYNAIDPNLFIDDDNDGNATWYLLFGSYWSGIQVVPIDPNTGKRSGNDSVVTLATRNSAIIEAPFLFKQDDYYYLFTSWDRCCQHLDSTYNTRVVRSRNILGPYVDQEGTDALDGGGSLVLSSHGSTVGPGGESVIEDNDGNPMMVYHYYTNTSALLGINRLDFSTGWPVPMEEQERGGGSSRRRE